MSENVLCECVSLCCVCAHLCEWADMYVSICCVLDHVCVCVSMCESVIMCDYENVFCGMNMHEHEW